MPEPAAVRYEYIDRAKGLAIVLVVVGHAVANQPPRGAQWYWTLKDGIYLFHMPLFVFLSGLAMGFSFHAPTGLDDYVRGLRRRTSRLLTGYLLLGLMIFAGKLAFQQVAIVDNPVHGVGALLDLLLRPNESPSRFLWYVYTLSLLYAAVPLLFLATSGRMWPLLILAGVLPALPSGTLLTWSKLQELSLYFVLGVVAGRNHAFFETLLRRVWAPALASFIVLVPWAPRDSVWAWICAMSAIVGLLGLLRQPWMGRLKNLQWIGTFTLSIYLFNTMFIGLLKMAWVPLFGWEGVRFIPALLALCAFGVLGPIALKRWVLRRVSFLERIT